MNDERSDCQREQRREFECGQDVLSRGALAHAKGVEQGEETERNRCNDPGRNRQPRERDEIAREQYRCRRKAARVKRQKASPAIREADNRMKSVRELRIDAALGGAARRKLT